MIKTIFLLLIFFSYRVSAQATQEDYNIYSKYLKVFIESKKVDRIYFVVNETTASNQNDDNANINWVVNDLKGNIKGDSNARSGVYLTFRDFALTLTKDTLWIPLLVDLNQKMKQIFKIENNFSPDLQLIVISDNTAKRYFKHSKTAKQIDRNWRRFHRKYLIPSVLIAFSEIISDGKRAVFYSSTRCGGLCSHGDLIFFSKENSQWEFLYSAPIWYN